MVSEKKVNNCAHYGTAVHKLTFFFVFFTTGGVRKFPV